MEGLSPHSPENTAPGSGFSAAEELKEAAEEYFSFDDAPEEATDKRFALNREPFAKERLATVRSEITKLKETYPEAVGFTMFGSMVRGRATEASDIDGYIFVDAEIAQQRHPDDVIFEDLNGETRLVPSMEAGYAQGLRAALESQHGFTPEQSQEIRVLPISKQLIDQELEALTQNIQAYEEYRNAQQAYWDSGMQGEAPQAPETPLVPTNLYGLFHLEVGQGLKPMREHLIQNLQQKGEIGQKVWEEIIRNTENMERGRDAEKANYPVSLESAQQLYGS